MAGFLIHKTHRKYLSNWRNLHIEEDRRDYPSSLREARDPYETFRHPAAIIRHPDAKRGISSRNSAAGVRSVVGVIGTS
jgi:hypothetical protein